MNTTLLRLIGLLKQYSDGEIHSLLENSLEAFADMSNYQIETIEELVDAMEDEMSYWED